MRDVNDRAAAGERVREDECVVLGPELVLIWQRETGGRAAPSPGGRGEQRAQGEHRGSLAGGTTLIPRGDLFPRRERPRRELSRSCGTSRIAVGVYSFQD